MTDNVVKIYIGCDESQILASKVLEYSIKRHSSLPVECKNIDNTMMPICTDVMQAPYTNFSFARFGIPKFNNYQGKAIHLDADMLVVSDISGLWNIPFNGTGVLLQEYANDDIKKKQSKQRKQTAVMMMDCSKLEDWIPEEIIGNLGRKYDRTHLMSLDFVDKSRISETIPAQWNCLDWFDKSSRLLHYTKIEQQPWVYPDHKYGDLWIKELKSMIAEGLVDEDLIKSEIEKKYIRPSLIAELGFGEYEGRVVSVEEMFKIDQESNYEMHKEMLERSKERLEAINQYKKSIFKKEFKNKLISFILSHPIKFILNPSKARKKIKLKLK